MERLQKQLEFLMEMDKLNRVVRQSYICGGERRENSAEHSWHTALVVLLLSEHLNQAIDPGRAMKLMLVHDVVEIGKPYPQPKPMLRSHRLHCGR